MTEIPTGCVGISRGTDGVPLNSSLDRLFDSVTVISRFCPPERERDTGVLMGDDRQQLGTVAGAPPTRGGDGRRVVAVHGEDRPGGHPVEHLGDGAEERAGGDTWRIEEPDGVTGFAHQRWLVPPARPLRHGTAIASPALSAASASTSAAMAALSSSRNGPISVSVHRWLAISSVTMNRGSDSRSRVSW
jgi:hypothetical protein